MTDLSTFDLTGKVSVVTGAARAMGCKVDISTTDVSEMDHTITLFEQLDRDFVRIDFLGNVAGGVIVFGVSEEISIEDFERSTKTLITGPFLMCQEVGRRMPFSGRWLDCQYRFNRWCDIIG